MIPLVGFGFYCCPTESFLNSIFSICEISKCCNQSTIIKLLQNSIMQNYSLTLVNRSLAQHNLLASMYCIKAFLGKSVCSYLDIVSR